MKIILHSYRRCPFCIRVRILLYLKGYEYEIVEESLRVWTPWMRAWAERTKEKARVPVLRIVHDAEGRETVLAESNEINLFLDAFDGKPLFTPSSNSKQYAEMIEWWDWCSRELKPAIDLYKYGVDRVWNKEMNQIHGEALQRHVLTLEQRLSGKLTQTLIGSAISLADIAIIPFIRQIARTRDGEFDFTPYPLVSAWSSTLLETEWFTETVMRKVTK